MRERIDDPALRFERNRNFMLPKELHNERFSVDLPVYHLLSRHNISFGLTDGGIVARACRSCVSCCSRASCCARLSSACRCRSAAMGALWASSYRPSRLANPRSTRLIRGFHALIENPLDLTPGYHAPAWAAISGLPQVDAAGQCPP